MKKVFVAIMLLAGSIAYAGPNPDVNEKVLKAFNQMYSTAKNVSWSEYEDLYEANFVIREVRTRVRYDKQGNILGTIRYYFEESLPPHILSRLKSKYTGKTVFGVTEVSSESDIEYIIVLEDAKHWTEVKSDSAGNLRVSKKFNKA